MDHGYLSYLHGFYACYIARYDEQNKSIARHLVTLLYIKQSEQGLAIARLVIHFLVEHTMSDLENGPSR